MAGEVIDMFGGGSKGPFGTSGIGEVIDTSGEDVSPSPGGPVQSGPAPKTAGDAPPPPLPGPAIVQELDIALGHARRAAHRLIDMVPPGALDSARIEELHSTFGVIQTNIATVASAASTATSEDALLSVNRDARDVVVQVQQYVEAVETAIGQVGGAPAGSALAPASRAAQGGNGLLWLALAIGVGAAGYGVWQLRQRRKK